MVNAMTLFSQDKHALPAGAVLSGIADKPTILRVINGRAWITSAGRGGDHWLHSGQKLSLEAKRLIVVEADRGVVEFEIACENTNLNLTAGLRVVITMLTAPFQPTEDVLR